MRHPERSVALQLARREGRRLVRHPFMWVGAVLSLVLFGFFTWHAAPVLHRDDSFAAGALLPLAATTLIVANLAASRSARDATEEVYDATSTLGRVRALGHLLSLSYAAAFGAGLLAVMFVYLSLDSPVGSPNPSEVAAGLLSIVLFGAAGIALGCWRPHPALGPLAVVVAVALEIMMIQPIIDLAATNSTTISRLPWFAAWVPSSLTGEVPPELVIRPAGWHALYLSGLIVVAAAFALSRSGPRARLVPLYVAGAALVVAGGAGQLVPPSLAQRAELASLLQHPEDHQVCEVRRGVTYCAYPAYAPWIDRWAAPVEGALDRIPPEARPTGLVVRQRLGSYFEGPIDVPPETLVKIERAERKRQRDRRPGDTIWTGIQWGRGATEGGFAIGLSLTVAMDALDFPESQRDIHPTAEEITRFERTVLPTLDEVLRPRAERTLHRQRDIHSCTTMHQARALAALWIAAQATPATRAAVTRALHDSPYGLTTYESDGRRFATYLGPFIPIYPQVRPPMWDRVVFADAEFHYAADLLDRPSDEVAATLADRWDEIAEPTTMTEELLDDLGLEPHETIDEQVAELPSDVKLQGGRRQWNPDETFVRNVPCF